MTNAVAGKGLSGALEAPRTVYSILFLYCALHMILRLGLSANFSPEESLQVLFGQSLQWAYQPQHPPLMTWLSWAALQGGGRAAFYLLKYALMALGLFAFFDTGRIVLGDVRLAALSTFALLTTFAMGYLAHADLMTDVLNASLLSCFLWAAVRALTRAKHNDYLLLGIVAGLGTLSDRYFLVLPISFAIAVGLVFTGRVRQRPLIGATLLACAIAAPYVWWSYSHAGAFFALPGTVAPPAPDFAKGVVSYAVALIMFVLPLIALFPAIYWRASAPLPLVNRNRDDTAWLHVFGIAMIIAGILLLAVALYSGVSVFTVPEMVSVLLPLPLWLFLRVKIAGANEGAHKIFLWSTIALAVVAAGAGVAIYETGAARCQGCGEYWPVDRYASSLRSAGFAQGTVVAPSAELGGNLRYWLGDARVAVPGSPPQVFGAAQGAQCLVVWPGSGAMPKVESDYVANVLGAHIGADAMRGDVETLLTTSKTRRDRLSYVLVLNGGGRCN